MLRTSLLSIVLLTSVAGCKTGVAPADEAYEIDDGLARSTALGIRTTLSAGEGAFDFGAHAVATGDGVMVTERSAEAVCGSRLRLFTDDGEGGYSDEGVTDCVTTNEHFGTNLSYQGGEFVSGIDAFYGSTDLTHDGALVADDTTDGDGYGSAHAVLSWSEIVVTAPHHGVSGAAYVFAWSDEGTFAQVAKISHPGVMENGGFGTAILGEENLLVVSDAFERQFAFERSDSGNWLSIDVPGVILALNGSTALVRPSFGSDLRFYDRRDGAWEATGILVGANLPYTEWVFDEVAAFAVQPGEGSFRGFADRYTRIDGELDASVRLTLDHTDLDLDLDLEGDHLVIAEAMTLGTSGSGQVHVFDWSEDRTRMLAELQCPLGDDASEPNDGTLEASDSMEGTFVVTSASDDFFALDTLAPGEAITIDLSILGDGDIDLYLWDAAGSTLGSSLSTTPSEQIIYTNAGDEPIELFARVTLFGSSTACPEYTIAAWVDTPAPAECGSFDNDTYETAVAPPSGEVVLDSVSAVDWYEFSGLYANEEITATLAFDSAVDLDLCLIDEAGEALYCAAGISTPETLSWLNETEDVLNVRLRVKWYSPPELPTCAPYTLTVAFEDIQEEAPPAP